MSGLHYATGRSRSPILGILGATAIALGGAGAVQAQDVSVPDAASRCAALAQRRVPADAFALPTSGATPLEAKIVAANGAEGEYCRLRGSIDAANASDPAIMFQVNLPSRWNLKTVQFGGGGSNGVLIEATGAFSNGGGSTPSALSRGFVTYGSDSGHQGRGSEFLDNPQAFANYSHEAVKRTKDLVTALVRTYYGRDARRNYHIGGSKGGQEALQAAQRYYADFDGVVSYYPAAQNQSLTIGWNRLWHFAFGTPGGALNTAEQTLLKQSVMKTCDGLDGATDGIVSNMAACETAFDARRLRCPDGGNNGDQCLSDVQIATLREAGKRFKFAYPMPNDVTSVGPWPVLTGGDLQLWLGNGVDGSQQAFYRATAARPEALKSTGLSRAAWAKVAYRAKVYDASNPDLDAFRAKGGKLLLVQGTTDMLVPLSMTTDYYKRISARYGAGLKSFARYYVAPGFGHGGGIFHMQWDSLSALDAWVEGGLAPAQPVATDGAAETRGRTRPLCEYPSWPKYRGSGSLDLADSFLCARR